MRTVLLGMCALMLSVCVYAQAPAAPAAPASAPKAVAPAQAPAPTTDVNAPVAVPEPSAKAMEFYHSGNKWWLFGVVWGWLVPAVILFTGLSKWMRDFARRIGPWWPVTIGLFWVFYSALTALIDLPVDYFREFVRMHDYGLSDQALSKFLQDWAISLAIDCVVGGLLIWIPYLLLRKSPKHWWIYTSILAVPFIVIEMLVQPIWIDPLFNKFGPMKDKALEGKILALADRAGIEGARVYEVEKSVDTNTVNAYVTGFMDSKRIVLWDTLLKKLDEKESLFVMAHEMGHYVLGHVAKSIVFGAILTTLALLALHLLSGTLIARFGARFGFSELSDPAALPLIFLVISVLSFVVMPVAMTYIRSHEHQADQFALEITHDNHSGATAFVKLQQENLANPRPDWFVKLWRGSHPTLGDRIDFCNDYHPWRDGKPGAFDGLFKAEK